MVTSTTQMYPPVNGNNSISFNGRTYSSANGAAVTVPNFDVSILSANGWSTTSPYVVHSTVINPLLHCANRGQFPNSFRAVTSSALQKCESRKSCWIGGAAQSELRLSYANVFIYNNFGNEVIPPNGVYLAVFLEFPGANGFQSVQVTFNNWHAQYGAANGASLYSQGNAPAGATGAGMTNLGGVLYMPPGATDVLSDPLYPWQFGLTAFPANTNFFIRETRAVNQAFNSNAAPFTGPSAFVANATVFVSHLASFETGETSNYCDPNVITTSVANLTGPLPTAGYAGSSCSFGPVAIVGRAIGTPDISVLILGDSLMDGTGDEMWLSGLTTPTYAAYSGGSGSGVITGSGATQYTYNVGTAGFSARALWGLNGRNVPFSKMTIGGSSIFRVAASQSARRAFFKYFTHAHVGYGSNDGVGINVPAPSQSASAVMNNLNLLFYSLKSGDSNIRHTAVNSIINRCPAPSPDNFATPFNMTPASGFANGGSFRQPLNALLQSAASSGGDSLLDQYIDITGPTSDTVLTDRWPSGTTTDGIHPWNLTSQTTYIQVTLAQVVANYVRSWS